MEEERKKKKNKKKKAKQAKTTEDVKVTAEGTTIHEQNHAPSLEQNHCTRVSEDADAQIPEVLESDVKLDRDLNDVAKGVILEEKVKQLEIEKNSCIQKEVILEEKVKQLEIEKNSCIQREVTLEEKVKQLEVEKDSCIQMEAGLQNKIIDLENEKDSWLQTEAGLQNKIIVLENEQNSWLQIEASLEEKIKQLLNEKAIWSLKEASLQDMIKQLESDKESWDTKEKINEETVARLHEYNRRIQLEVKVLQESRDGFIRENQHLTETVSVMQSKFHQLENESSFLASSPTRTEKVHPNEEVLKAQIEAARALVERLIIENAELVEKVNELCIERDRRSVVSPKDGSDRVVMEYETATISNDMPDMHEQTSENVRSPAFIQTNGLSAGFDHHVNGHTTAMLSEISRETSGSYEAGETGEIVQIPLDESDTGEMEPQLIETNERSSGVSLSDAPLTGAPFRMISFVARYVSGADLVNKNASNSGRQ